MTLWRGNDPLILASQSRARQMLLANAGHTVVVGDQTYKLHHIPSGILNPHVMNVVGPGVVLRRAWGSLFRFMG